MDFLSDGSEKSNNFECKFRRMKILKEIKKRKIPIVTIDKSLNDYEGKVLFPEKLQKANDMLKKVGIPEKWMSK
jgi:hypothetical protein